MDRKLNLNRAETFSFVNPWIRYFLFFFSFLFWVSRDLHCLMIFLPVVQAMRDTFLIDPAVILIVVGVVMFFITFCGCIGALRENIRLLKTFSFSLTLVFLTQLAIAILGFFYSDQVSTMFLNIYLCCALLSLSLYLPITQFKCCGWNNYTDWSWNLYFNCTHTNPSSERCSVPYSCCTPVPGEAQPMLSSYKTVMSVISSQFKIQNLSLKLEFNLHHLQAMYVTKFLNNMGDMLHSCNERGLQIYTAQPQC
uniref:Tetraspanin 33b n=1 Tax=Seriola lalandi dorsalis TaxID=1841481 RepID=A0A3B4XBY7_SERLL